MVKSVRLSQEALRLLQDKEIVPITTSVRKIKLNLGAQKPAKPINGTPITQAQEIIPPTKKLDVILPKPTKQEITKAQQTEYEIALNKACAKYPDITLDPSQRDAVLLMLQNPYACLVGNAGTGKSMVTKFFIAALRELALYKREKPIIVGCAFTGTAANVLASQIGPLTEHNIKCSTIHKLLAYKPDNVFSQKQQKITRQFVPTYHEQNKLDVDIILIDEGSMVQIDLWNNLYKAVEKHVRIYLIGDIQQLKPAIGHSVLGYAMNTWPVAGLQKIHRQAADNPIISNAYNVLQGKSPISHKGIFNLVKLPADPHEAFRFVTRSVKRLYDDDLTFDYRKDMIICAQNIGPLGQEAFNKMFRNLFNPHETIHEINVTRGKTYFAIGDKVMCNVNQTATIVNGSTGIIKDIELNPDYDNSGYIQAQDLTIDTEQLDAFDAGFTAPKQKEYQHAVSKEEQETEDQKQCSHRILIHFDGHKEATWFSQMGQVTSLSWGYARTCHKSQGSQARLVIVILHKSIARYITREWVYTALTRSTNYVILFGDNSITPILGRQSIEGVTFEEKIKAFSAMNNKATKLPVLPISKPYDEQTYDDLRYRDYKIIDVN